MKNLFLLLCLYLFSFTTNSVENIVGGVDVDRIERAPFMASFVNLGCGGSIIDKRWILTAAHCFVGKRGGVVKVGTIDNKGKAFKYKIEKVIIHPKYNKATYHNDFALLKLATPIDFKKTKARRIRLATMKHEQRGHLRPGKIATVYGWGLTTQRGRGPHILKKVRLPIVSRTMANRPSAYNGQVDQTMLAVGLPEGGKDACQGDSGGPLIVFFAGGAPIQAGVVSWGEGCARKKKYGIYSRVSTAYNWIASTIRRNQ